MRDFSVVFLFVLGGLFAIGWSCFLWGALSRFIKVSVGGLVGYSLFLTNRREGSILAAHVPRPACLLNTNINSYGSSSAEFIWCDRFGKPQKQEDVQNLSKLRLWLVITLHLVFCVLASSRSSPPCLPLLSCCELRFWSSKPGQPHYYSADGNNLCVWLW